MVLNLYFVFLFCVKISENSASHYFNDGTCLHDIVKLMISNEGWELGLNRRFQGLITSTFDKYKRFLLCVVGLL